MTLKRSLALSLATFFLFFSMPVKATIAVPTQPPIPTDRTLPPTIPPTEPVEETQAPPVYVPPVYVPPILAPTEPSVQTSVRLALSLEHVSPPAYPKTASDLLASRLLQGFLNGPNEESALVRISLSRELGEARSYTLRIKEGAVFSDGRPVLAQDLIFSLYLFSDPSYEGPYSLKGLPLVGLSAYRKQRSVQDEEKAKAWWAALEAKQGRLPEAEGGPAEFQAASLLAMEDRWEALCAAIVDHCAAHLAPLYPSFFPEGSLTEANKVAFASAVWGLEGERLEEMVAFVRAKYGQDYARFAEQESPSDGFFEDQVRERVLALAGFSVPRIEGIRPLDQTAIELDFHSQEAPQLSALDLPIFSVEALGSEEMDLEAARFGFPFGQAKALLLGQDPYFGAGPYAIASGDPLRLEKQGGAKALPAILELSAGKPLVADPEVQVEGLSQSYLLGLDPRACQIEGDPHSNASLAMRTAILKSIQGLGDLPDWRSYALLPLDQKARAQAALAAAEAQAEERLAKGFLYRLFKPVDKDELMALKAALEMAGQGGKKLRLALLGERSLRRFDTLLERAQGDLKAVGIDLEIRVYEDANKALDAMETGACQAFLWPVLGALEDPRIEAFAQMDPIYALVAPEEKRDYYDRLNLSLILGTEPLKLSASGDEASIVALTELLHQAPLDLRHFLVETGN